jgi:hypothetical protein
MLTFTFERPLLYGLPAMKSIRSTARPLHLERLETRSLMAGDVTVNKDGGSLFIRGDDESNAVVIRRVGNNRYEVTGIDDANGDPTTVNGVASGTVTFSGIKRNIDVRLRGGDDLLGIGNDDADLTDLLDELTGGAAFAPGTSDRVKVKNDLKIDMGSGDDAAGIFVDVKDTTIIDLGAGTDFLAVEGSRLGDDLIIRGEEDNDFIRVRDSKIDEFLLLVTNGGEDTVNIINVNAEDAKIDLGGQSDTAEIDDLDVRDNLFVFLRDGDDELSIGNSKAKRAFFRGADGSDTFTDDLGNDFDNRQRSGFETIA